MSDIEQFWRKIHDESGVKNCKLFEGVSPSSCNLARRVMNPKIACGASKRLFTSSSYFPVRILSDFFKRHCKTSRRVVFESIAEKRWWIRIEYL